MKKLFALTLILLILAGCAGNKVDRVSETNGQIRERAGVLRVHFLDVGQGDSILAQFPDGRNMLVDAGGNNKADSVVDYLNRNGIKKLDFLAGTHPHEDHIGGLDTVIEKFEIGAVFMPKATANTRTFRDVLTVVNDKGLKITAAKAGIVILEEGDLSVKIVAPRGASYENLNNCSMVIHIKYGDIAFLLTGDAEELSEKEILASRTYVKAQVLKVGHHGSRSSTSREFIKAVKPEYAVISSGAGNDYHHPHPVTLEKLHDAGVTVLRTDEKGTIVFETDGRELFL